MKNRLMGIVEDSQMKKDVPVFTIGDLVDVHQRILEGQKERVQVFSGTVIARRGDGMRETFTVRRIVQGEGVERIFPLHSPRIAKVEVKRTGRVRRAKLYYLRDRVGKATRLRERRVKGADTKSRTAKKKGAAAPAPEPAPAQQGMLDILYEDNHCLAILKPGGRLSTHFQGQEETLDREVKRYLKDKYHKPGNVFLGIVHRLDRPVSGVLLFARTSKAAARLAQQFREGTVDKIYWAVVEGAVRRQAGTLEDWLYRDRAARRVEVVEAYTPGARQALLHYHQRACHGGLTWLEVRPQTGRTHQLRVQLAHHGHPLYGDAKYGSLHTFGQAIGLHARSLTFLHPIRYEPLTLTADLPRAWRGRFAYLFREALP